MAHSENPSDRFEDNTPAPLIPVSEILSPSLDIEQVRGILPQLIDALADAVLVVDRQHRVVAANRRYLETFGGTRPDLIGGLCNEVLGCAEIGAPRPQGGCRERRDPARIEALRASAVNRR